MKTHRKTAVVTGGNKGIGKGISIRLSREDINVVIAARDESAANDVIDGIQKEGNTCCFIRTDVSSKKDVDMMIDEVIHRFKGIDILVNNAAVVIDSPFLDITEGVWDRTIDVNLKGYFLCAQAAARVMAADKKGGKIINIASVQGVTVWTDAFHAPYEVSKAGIIMLTKQLAYELAPYGINVNAVAPGPTETEILEPWTKSPDKLRSITKNIPLGRVAKVSDVAGVVNFLVSSEADYITGITVFVDGGRLTW
ncbi:MAG: glucose 1-dehydrogenase [Spirochaetes bacterium]|nr:glucose 1-dehydrogenase [Spirochaetota bacterium]